MRKFLVPNKNSSSQRKNSSSLPEGLRTLRILRNLRNLRTEYSKITYAQKIKPKITNTDLYVK